MGQQASERLSCALAHGFPHMPCTMASIFRLILQTTRREGRLQKIGQYRVGIRQGDHSRVISHLSASSPISTVAADGYTATGIDGAGEIGVQRLHPFFDSPETWPPKENPRQGDPAEGTI